MGNNLLLVGSVPLASVEEVMRTFGGALAGHLPAIPDGEVGERRSWVNRLSYQIFNGHMDLETIRRPQPVDGVEQLLPRSRDDVWNFRVRPGVERVRFGHPGSRLGYARDAASSYFVFRTLREKGIIPGGVRFQISMPMVNSVIRPLYFPDAGDLGRVRPGYEEAIAAEVAAILATIPNEDLAIQWDCAWEVSAVHGTANDIPAESEIETHVTPIGRLSENIPDIVQLGFHFCFGTFGGMAGVRARRSGPDSRTDQRGGRKHGPPCRLGPHPNARYIERGVLRPLGKSRREGSAHLSRRHPQHGNLESAIGYRPRVPAGFRLGRVLRLRSYASG